MLLFTIKRLSLFFFTMLTLTIFTFSLSYLFPGDSLVNITGQTNLSPEELNFFILDYKFNENIMMQYIAYIQHIFSLEFGVSLATELPIAQHLATLLPATIELSLVSLIIALLIGVPLGFTGAIFNKKLPDNIIMTVSIIGYSIPIFWLSLFMILLFSIGLGWFPSSGHQSLLFEIESVTGFQLIDTLLSNSSYKWQAFIDAINHLILPATAIALAPMTVFIRIARSSMLEVLNTNYMMVAKVKGLKPFRAIYNHALRNAGIKVIHYIGLQFASLITIAMITEVIFKWPGIGRWLITSIFQRDYPAIQGGVLVLAIFIFFINIFFDFIFAFLNPLAREGKADV